MCIANLTERLIYYKIILSITWMVFDNFIYFFHGWSFYIYIPAINIIITYQYRNPNLTSQVKKYSCPY